MIFGVDAEPLAMHRECAGSPDAAERSISRARTRITNVFRSRGKSYGWRGWRHAAVSEVARLVESDRRRVEQIL